MILKVIECQRNIIHVTSATMSTIKRIAPLSLAKLQGVLLGLMGLIVVVPLLLLSFIFPVDPGMEEGVLPSLWFFILIPVIYAVMGFIMGLITALLYNLVSQWIGGLEITIE